MWFIKNKYKDLKNNINKIEFIEKEYKELLKNMKKLERILKYGQIGYHISEPNFIGIDNSFWGGKPIYKYIIYIYKGNEEYEIKDFNFISNSSNDCKVKNIKFIDNNVFINILINEKIKSYAIDLNSKKFIEISNWKDI